MESRNILELYEAIFFLAIRLEKISRRGLNVNANDIAEAALVPSTEK